MALVLLSVSIAWPGQGQDLPAAAGSAGVSLDRPRIGLVLSGGGARGAAHVGVLQVLQKYKVPIDAIAGTSMGAVVGGLYAAGVEPADLDKIIRDIDWQDAFSDRAARNTRRFRRRQDDTGFLVKFDLGFNRGQLQLPRGLIQGQKLNLILRELTLPVSQIDQFDQLPTRFRAVAADLTDGSAVVLGSGDLVTAMRASMSAPGVFAPVEYGGRVLVDGGLVKNIPIDVAQAMGVDIVIAVDVGFPLRAADDLNSAVAVADQMLTILIRREADQQIARLKPTDILLAPPLGDYSSVNFADLADVIPLGAATAEGHAELWKTLAIPAAEYDDYLIARAARREDLPIPAFVRVEGDSPLSDRVITSRLGFKPGAAFDTETIANDAAQIFGFDLFESVDYSLVTEGDEIGLQYRTIAKSWGPNYLRFGLAFEEDFEGSSEFNVGARYTRTAVNRLGAEWRTDLQIGTNPRLFSEFYQPLSFDLRYFIAPEVTAEQRNIDLFAEAERIGRYRVSNLSGALSLGREIGNSAELRAGLRRTSGNARLKVGGSDLPNIEFDRGGYFVSAARDTLDDPQFPRAGTRLDLSWQWERRSAGSDVNANLVSIQWDKFRSFGRHTLGFGVSLETTESGEPGLVDLFELGGFLGLSGLDRGQLRGPHAALIRMTYFRRLGDAGNGILDWPLYVGASLEAGNVWQSRDEADFESLRTNGSLFVGLDTAFGPVFFATGFSESGDSSVYLFLGSPVR